MEITPTSIPGIDVPIVERQNIGFAGLNADSFMKLLITELQNQDPTEPIRNEELVNQLATMRNLQANIELGDAIKAITSNQQLSTAAGFIGKSITGNNEDEEEVTGVVDRAFLVEGKAYVGVGNETVPLTEVLAVNQV